MPPRRTKPLPTGIYARPRADGSPVYWISFNDETGARVQERGGTSIEEAVRLRAARLRAVADGTFARGAATGQTTLASYSERWVQLRAAEGVRTYQREAQTLRDHVLPHLGSMPLAELRPRDVARWVRALRATSMAPKSILNAHGVLGAMLSRAAFDEAIPSNPARDLPPGILPRNERVRQVAAWTRDEVETLIGDERIPEPFRVAWAIATFTGARIGEVAGLRWRDLDTKAAPLWRWALRTQYDGEPLKTGRPRDVPVHPELRRVLERWRLEGWARWTCHAPRPDDFVVPRENRGVHSKESLGAKAVARHCALVGIERGARDVHSFRRAMVTLARTDGARSDILERVTHNAAGEQIDGYTYFGWDALCEAVSCLRVQVRKGASVVAIRRAAVNGDCYAPCYTEAPRGGNLNVLAVMGMEAPGVEPCGSAAHDGNQREIEGSSVAQGRVGGPQDPARSVSVPVDVTRVTALAREAAALLRAAGHDEHARAIESLIASW